MKEVIKVINGLDIIVITGLSFAIAALIYAIVVLSFDKDVDDEDLKEEEK